jgi:HSP20 family protein
MSDWFSGRRTGSLMRDFGTLQNEVNRVFADLGFSPPGQNAAGPGMGANLTTAPQLDVVTTENGGYEIHVDLPGLEDKDIDLSVDGDLLTLRGERRQDRDEARRNYRVRERAFGTFSRTIALPFEARPEQIDAEFKNGVLTIRVERPREPERSGSKVNIRSGAASSAIIEGEASATTGASAGASGGASTSGGSVGEGG